MLFFLSKPYNYFLKIKLLMNKKIKWGIVSVIGLGLTFLAVRTFIPHENKELAESPTKAPVSNRNRTLNVIAEVIKESSIGDG